MTTKIVSKTFHVDSKYLNIHISVSSQQRLYVFTVCKLWPKYVFPSLMLLMGATV